MRKDFDVRMVKFYGTKRYYSTKENSDGIC